MKYYREFLICIILLSTSMLLGADTTFAASCTGVTISSTFASPAKVSENSPNSTLTAKLNAPLSTCPERPVEIYEVFFEIAGGANIRKTTPLTVANTYWNKTSLSWTAEISDIVDDPFRDFPESSKSVIWRSKLLLGSTLKATGPPTTITRDKGYSITPTPTPLPTGGGGGTQPTPTALDPSTANGTVNYGQVIGTVANPLTAQSLPELVTSIIRVLLALIAMAAVLVIIISGFRMVTNGGDPAALKSAKNGIIWAILGLVVALLSFSVVAILQRLIS